MSHAILHDILRTFCAPVPANALGVKSHSSFTLTAKQAIASPIQASTWA